MFSSGADTNAHSHICILIKGGWKKLNLERFNEKVFTLEEAEKLFYNLQMCRRNWIS